jgi:hypothetical protein
MSSLASPLAPQPANFVVQITAAVVREKNRSVPHRPARIDRSVERMMTFYPLAQINRAALDSSLGATIKPSCACRIDASRRGWRAKLAKV